MKKSVAVWSQLIVSGLFLGCGERTPDPGRGAEGSPAGAPDGPINMGPMINSEARDAEPTFTADGRTMYYNCNDRLPDGGADICISHLVDGSWTEGQVVGPPISTEYGEVEPLLSPDGNQLYIMSNRPGGQGGADIWVSQRLDDGWSTPENLGPTINSEFQDHCLYFSGPDWNTAYWTSTRPGGYGGNDIWTAERVDGIWGDAVNLGPDVNSSASEHHSLPSPDGRSLYVTSDRAGGHGGEDIYVTTRDANGEWGALDNLGLVVNSESNDRCPAFSPDYRIFYFDSEREGGYGNKDLWWIDYERVTESSR